MRPTPVIDGLALGLCPQPRLLAQHLLQLEAQEGEPGEGEEARGVRCWVMVGVEGVEVESRCWRYMGNDS